MTYRIAIPTYRRHETIQAGLFLEENNIDPSVVDVFVSDKTDFNNYRKHLGQYNIINTQADNLQDKHNYITDYYDSGQQTIIVEDDVRHLVKKAGSKSRISLGLHQLATIGFHECKANNVKMWGISPTDNGFYMHFKHGLARTLSVGYMFGVINDKSLRITTSLKHDFERSAIHNIMFGGAIRFHAFGVKHLTSFSAAGGLQLQYSKEARAAAEEQAVQYLINRYPDNLARSKRLNKVLDAYIEMRVK